MVTVLSRDASEVATLQGHTWLPTVDPDGDAPVLLLDGDDVVELATATATATAGTRALGVTLDREAYALSLIGETLVAIGDDGLSGRRLRDDAAPWRLPGYPTEALTDRARLFVVDASATADAVLVTGLRLPDGTPAWTFLRTKDEPLSDEAWLSTAGGRLVVADGPELVALAA